MKGKLSTEHEYSACYGEGVGDTRTIKVRQLNHCIVFMTSTAYRYHASILIHNVFCNVLVDRNVQQD